MIETLLQILGGMTSIFETMVQIFLFTGILLTGATAVFVTLVARKHRL